ncbi:MAG: hypothetical protein GY739_04580, partial [Mesoflavibacter sp.]|nr:hypothetical protein [Mesoflavibacter sp.]
MPILIEGVLLTVLSLLDLGASLSVLVPADLLPDIFKDRLEYVMANIKPVRDVKILQVEGNPIRIDGWLHATVSLCGQSIWTPIYICPNMSKADGVIVGCHSLKRLGFTMFGPDGVDYLGSSDWDDNAELSSVPTVSAPRATPLLRGGEGKEVATESQESGSHDPLSPKASEATDDARPVGKEAPRASKAKRKAKKRRDETATSEMAVEMAVVDGKGSCFSCSSVRNQFVSFENASALSFKADLSPPDWASLFSSRQDGTAYLFTPTTELGGQLQMEEMLVDVNVTGCFQVPVANVSRARVFLDKGRKVGVLEQVSGVLPVLDYLKQER